MLQAIFVGGNATRLIELANTETDPRAAPHRHPQPRDRWARPARARRSPGSTQKEKDPALQAQIIQALFLQGNAEPLVAIARKETDVDAKKAIVQQLSLMKSKVATDYLLEILGK